MLAFILSIFTANSPHWSRYRRCRMIHRPESHTHRNAGTPGSYTVEVLAGIGVSFPDTGTPVSFGFVEVYDWTPLEKHFQEHTFH